MFKASVVLCGLISFPAVISGKCLVSAVPVLGSLLFYCHSNLSGLYTTLVACTQMILWDHLYICT